LAELPDEILENLYPGEDVLYSVKKKLYTELKPKYLIVTDRRIIYLDQKILGRYDLIDIPYEKLEFVHFKKGKIGAKFIIRNEEGEEIVLTWMEKDEAEKAIEAIRDAINAIAVEPVSIQKRKGILGFELELSKPKEFITRTYPQAVAKAAPKEDPIERIRKLKELYESGVISREEFEEKKRKLLDQI
jgi:hypothetical protein